jgi:hypothetical protein
MATTLSRKDSEFNLQQRIITDKAEDNLVQWSISQPWFASTLIPARTNWETIYANYIVNPAERTKNMTFLKTETHHGYEPIVRQLVTIMVGNPVVSAIVP